MSEQTVTFVPTNKAMRAEAMSELLVGINCQMYHLKEMMGYSVVQSDPKHLEWLQTRLATLKRLRSSSTFIHELDPVLSRIFPEDQDAD
jgi:hypothetical protein